MNSNLSFLSHVLFYDGEFLRWKISVNGHGGKRNVGDVAGWLNGSGYWCVGGKHIPGGKQFAHRVIWSLCNGEIPKGMTIDHIDGNKGNNKIENLRCVTHQENLKNVRRLRTNTSGVVGVRFLHKAWRARIVLNNKDIHLGTYTSKDDAIQARAIANILCGFHLNHGSARCSTN
jgi:hypothetical protein